eukprot:m.45308 g.45308  ORF g.45308 m.45308 type:complete len:202 (-) comp12431_c0_seq1:233-838(-)
MEVNLTDVAKTALLSACDHACLAADAAESARACVKDKKIAVSLLQRLRKQAADAAPKKLQGCLCSLYLHELVSGALIVEKSPVPPEPSPELVARRKKLKERIAEMEYQRMVRDVETKKSDFDSDPFDVRETQRQLSIGFNFIATFFTCLVFGYCASAYTFTSLEARVLTGLLCAFVAVGAELYFLMRVSIRAEMEESAKKR